MHLIQRVRRSAAALAGLAAALVVFGATALGVPCGDVHQVGSLT